MKIPTILVIAFLSILVTIGVSYFFYQQKITDQKKAALTPQQIIISNITDQTATVSWQTNVPSVGKVFYQDLKNQEQSKGDDRDLKTAEPRLIHYATLNNLEANRTYSFKLKNDQFSYDTTVQIKTGAILSESSMINQSIIGSVIDKQLNPISEGLVFLEVENGSLTSTFITNTGSFILPLKNLRSADLTAPLNQETTEGTLEIKMGDTTSLVGIYLNTQNKPLPPIILGQNIDLRNYIKSLEVGDKSISSNLDVNGDGRINGLDISFISRFVPKQNEDGTFEKKVIEDKDLADYKKADLDGNGLVDQADLDLIRKSLQN